MVTGGAKIGGRALKRKVRSLLGGPDLDSALAQIRRLPPRQVVNPLFSFFCSLDPTLKWRAVSAMGVVVANLAAGEDEFARVVMRRLMWSLNDESGGIGWGAPEAMGEIMARSRTLADEFGTILLSYLQPQGNNYLEHALLQRGLLWGLGRLAHVNPLRVRPAAPALLPFLGSPDPFHRGLAAWTAGALAWDGFREPLKALCDDAALLEIYCRGRLQPTSVGDLAREALQFAEGPRKPAGKS